MQIALDIVRTGDPNLRFFNHPSFLFYINALAYMPYLAWRMGQGRFSGPMDIPLPE